jgi:nucleoprotein TPR
MKVKAADAEKQAAAIAEAVEKAKAEINASSNAEPTEALVKRHGEELKALEDKLKAEHEASLKAAVEEIPKARPEGSSDQAAIDAAVAEVEKKAQARLQEEISAAVERGRMEQAAKNKLKDSQLVKAQKRVKELEQQIHEWQASGINLPPPSAATPTTPIATSTNTAATATKPAAIAGQPTANQPQTSTNQPSAKPGTTGPSQPPKPPATAVTAASSASQPTLPRKPPLGPSGASATRGGAIPQGPGRGGVMMRGGRGGAVGRGGAPLRQPPVKPTAPAAPVSGGVSIMGAASKRPREESASSSEDSLAKRLKPADSTT